MVQAFLAGERIYLRGLEKADFTERLLRWRNDPEVTMGVKDKDLEVLNSKKEMNNNYESTETKNFRNSLRFN